LDNASDLRSWCFTGIILGLASLVKPHALFLLPAIVAYILYVSRKKDSGWALQAISKTGIFVACTFFTKFLISYLIAGKAGVTIFGPMYTSMASSTTSNYQRYIELLTLSGKSVKGHVLAICLMFGMPIAFAIYASFNSVVSKVRIKIGQKISFYTLAVLFSLVLFTSFFTALVANTNPYETAARLHMRYYNFALPLLFVVAASQLSLDSITGKFRWRLTIALPIGAAILYAVSTRMVPYTPNLVDNPELRGFMFNSTVFYILSGLSFLALALWVYAARAGAKIFIYFFMPLAIAFSTFYVNQELRPRLAPNVYVKAGIFTKQYLSNNDLSKVVIVGSEPLGLYRSVSLFYMDNPEASLETIPRGSAYNLSRLPAGKEWVLIIGDHSLSENTFFQLPMNGFTLVRASGNNTVRFKKSAWPGILSRTSGLFPAEAWGTWSSSKFVTLEFSMPLPEKFTVHLVAHAYGPNVGKEFLAHVGDNSIGFKLSASPEERKLKFSNPKRLRTIIIDIPLAVSPKELGLGDDDRSLGIALTELRIVPL
jgi:phosphoglycerol transferase